MEQKKLSKGKIAACVAALVVVIGVLAGVYLHFSAKPVAGAKTITVEVIAEEGKSQSFTYHTDAEYLGEVLQAEGLIEGTSSEYGLYITTVNGVTADESKQQRWSITKDGGIVDTGVDTTPIADGEHYELTLSVW